MTMMNHKPFSRLRELLEKSTPGEWEVIKEAIADESRIYLKLRQVGVPISIAKMTIEDDLPEGEQYEETYSFEFCAEVHNTLPKVLEALDLAVGALKKMDVSQPAYSMCIQREALAKIKKILGE